MGLNGGRIWSLDGDARKEAGNCSRSVWILPGRGKEAGGREQGAGSREQQQQRSKSGNGRERAKSAVPTTAMEIASAPRTCLSWSIDDGFAGGEHSDAEGERAKSEARWVVGKVRSGS